jgi:hypothetical protein
MERAAGIEPATFSLGSLSRDQYQTIKERSETALSGPFSHIVAAFRSGASSPGERTTPDVVQQPLLDDRAACSSYACRKSGAHDLNRPIITVEVI